MTKLEDVANTVLMELHTLLIDLQLFDTYEVLPLLKEYDDIKRQEVEEVKLIEDDLTDEPSDYTVLSPNYSKTPEQFDEWGQGYGRCPTCGMPWQIVRPGKGQPACECSNV